jgi:hypothetical protein
VVRVPTITCAINFFDVCSSIKIHLLEREAIRYCQGGRQQQWNAASAKKDARAREKCLDVVTAITRYYLM